ncbi:hypothetical protein [Pistricoccus aurantiacus]|uniref:hypothetical protein n=1 Tax=Pistricoccus aurantiacus TaxID=1883414 RepID=UPI0036375B66
MTNQIDDLAQASDALSTNEKFSPDAISAQAQPAAAQASDTQPLIRKARQSVSSAVVSWTAEVPHLAGVSGVGKLWVFRKDPGLQWRAEDASATVGRRFSVVRPVAWSTPNGRATVEHLALPDRDGHLIVLFRSAGKDWRLVDVSALTGRQIHRECRIAALQYHADGELVEHLVAVEPSGEAVEFSYRPSTNWRAADVLRSFRPYRRLKIAPTSLTAWGNEVDGTTHVQIAGVDPDGQLVEVRRSRPASGVWRFNRVSSSGSPSIRSSGTVFWRTGSVEHLAAADNASSLVLFWRNSGLGGNWNRVDVTAECGAQAVQVSAAYVLSAKQSGTKHATECLVALGPERRLGNHPVLRLWWSGKFQWQSQDITAATGVATDQPVETWVAADGDEHLAVLHPHHRINEIYNLRASRQLAEALTTPVKDVEFSRSRSRKATVLCWTFRDSPIPSNTQEIAEAAFGSSASNSATDYFKQVSGGAFRLENGGIHGWFRSDFPRAWYQGMANPEVPEEVEEARRWRNRHHRKYFEALRDGNQAIDFAAADKNRNKRLEVAERGLVIAVAEAGSGFVRAARRQQVPDQPLYLDAVRMGDIVEWYAGSPPDTPTLVHEQCHLYLGLPDMHSTTTPYAVDGFDIMSQRGLGGEYWAYAHPCGVWKMMLGWSRPSVALRSGRYTLDSVATGGQALVLPHPIKGAQEYFLIENRQGSQYDDLTDQGLAVWHYIASRKAARRVPFGTGAKEWARWNDSPRQQLRLIRPALDGGMFKALWGGTDPDANYPLTSRRPDPNKAALVWADGSESGYTVQDISPLGESMSFWVKVP